MHAMHVALLLFLAVSVLPAQVRPRPSWAGQVFAFGELEPILKNSELARTTWQRNLAVCGQERTGVWVFDPKSGNLTLFDRRGQLRDAIPVRSWQPRDSAFPWAGLACMAKDDRFVFWNKNEVVVFSKDGIIRELKIPAMAVRDLVPSGDDTVVAIVPAVFRTDPEAKGFALAEAVMWRVNDKGEVTSRFLETEPVPGIEPFAQALANQVLLAASSDRLFATAQHGRYRVWAFDLRGRKLWRFEDQKLGLRPTGSSKKEGTPPAELTDEAKKAFRPLSVPFTVRAVTATRDWLWVLFDPGVFEGQWILDVFPVAGEEPVARFKLNSGNTWIPRALVVTDEAIWVFPAGDGQPQAFLRPPDEVLASALPARTNDP